MMANAEGTPYEEPESQGGVAGEETSDTNETIAAKDPEKEQMKGKIHIMKMEIERLTSDFARDKMKWEEEREQLQKELQHYKSLAQKVPDDDISSKAACLMRDSDPSKSQLVQGKKKCKPKNKKAGNQKKANNEQAAKSNQIPTNDGPKGPTKAMINAMRIALQKIKKDEASIYYEKSERISEQIPEYNVQKPCEVKQDTVEWVEKTALIFQDSVQKQDIKQIEPQLALLSIAALVNTIKQEPEQTVEEPIAPPSKSTDSEENIYFLPREQFIEKTVKQEPEQNSQEAIAPPSKATNSEENIYFMPMDPIGCLERTVNKLPELDLKEPNVQPSTSIYSKVYNLFLPRDRTPIELPLDSFSGVTEQQAPLGNPMADYARVQLRGQFTLFLLNHVCKMPESLCCIQEFRNSVCHADNCTNGPNCDRYICQRIHAKLEHLKSCKDRTKCKFCQSYVYFDESKWLGMIQLFEQSCPFKTPIANKSQASGREAFMSMVTRLAVSSGMVGDVQEEEVVIENDIPELGDAGNGESFYSASSSSDSDSECSESDAESSSSSSSSSDSSAGSSWSSCGAGGTSEEYEIIES